MTPAASRLVTMGQLFLIAVVIVAPVAVVVGRRILRDVAARRAANAPTPPPPPPRDPLAEAVATLTDRSQHLADGEVLRVPLPRDARLPPTIRDAIVADAAVRAGLVIVEQDDDAVVCRRREAAGNVGRTAGGPRE